MRHRRFVPSYAAEAGSPGPVLNTTPLIDVMLVLLILFIVTVPIATHKVPLDLPQGPATEQEPTVHRLLLDAAGALIWDGRAIADAELPALLAAMQAEENAVLHLRADGEARYERFDELLATVKRAGITKLGMVGNEQFTRHLR